MKCCAGDLSAAAEVRRVTCSAAELRNLDIELLRVCFDKGIGIHQKADAARRKFWCCRRRGPLNWISARLNYVLTGSRWSAAIGRNSSGSWSYSGDRK